MIMQLSFENVEAFLKSNNITDYSNLIIMSGGMTFSFIHMSRRRHGFLSLIDGKIHLSD